MHERASRPYPLSRVAGFATGSLAIGVFSTVPTVLLLYFCTQMLAIPPAIAAAIVFIPKIWGVAWDPMIGAWSDRTHTRFGRRKPFMAVGGLIMSLSFVALFSWPYDHAGQAAVLVGALYFLMASAYSVFAVPYVSFPSEASPLEAERQRLVAWRLAFGLAGVLLGSTAAPMIVAAQGGGAASYGVMSVVVAGVCAVGMALALIAMPSHPGGVPVQRAAAPSFRALMTTLAQARDFRRLLIAYIVMMTGSGVLISAATYWTVFVLRADEAAAGGLLGALLAATIVALPLWSRLAILWNARDATLLSAGLYGVSSLSLLLVGPGTSASVGMAAFALIGATFSGFQVGPFGLLAHLVHDQARRSGQGVEGLMTGLWTAGEKIALALGPAILGLCLAAFGFVSGAHEQGPRAIAGVRWVIGIGPAVFALLSIVLLLRVRRDRDA